MHTFLSLILGLFLFVGTPDGNFTDGIPKGKQGTFALTNARIETISNGVIENGTVVIKDDMIIAVGADVEIPAGAEIIDCAGLTVYPGMIDGGTTVGLLEIGAVQTTRDQSENGDLTPHVHALTAINPSSVIIPVTRVSGVTTVLSNPSNGLMPGHSALINMHGYTPEQMFAGFEAVRLNFPTTGRRSRFDRRSDEDIKKAAQKALKKLNTTWDAAVLFAKVDSAYTANPEDGRRPEYNPAMASLMPIVRGEAPFLIEVNAAADIQSAIGWVEEKGIKAIFTGVSEGWRVADEIAKSGIPCVVGPILGMPTRGSDRYDKPYANAGLLHAAGVKIAIRTTDTENARNLPYNAGFAAAYGLGQEAALRAITLGAAEIFGVADQLGSIEVGKKATLFVADGDPFETKTDIKFLFINGYNLPLVSRHTQLYDEYLERNPGLTQD